MFEWKLGHGSTETKTVQCRVCSFCVHRQVAGKSETFCSVQCPSLHHSLKWGPEPWARAADSTCISATYLLTTSLPPHSEILYRILTNSVEWSIPWAVYIQLMKEFSILPEEGGSTSETPVAIYHNACHIKENTNLHILCCLATWIFITFIAKARHYILLPFQRYSCHHIRSISLAAIVILFSDLRYVPQAVPSRNALQISSVSTSTLKMETGGPRSLEAPIPTHQTVRCSKITIYFSFLPCVLYEPAISLFLIY
jgi:hypothetical protein